MAIKSKKRPRFDSSFYDLATSVDKSLKANFDGTSQKQQVEKLLKAEAQFKNAIIKSAQGPSIYKKFISQIVVANGNRLTANPFFRENRKVFTQSISPALESGDWKALQKFSINHKMAVFMKESWRGDFPEKLQTMFDEIVKARNSLIVNNMPLAINRAKLFYSKVPRSHIDLLDMISLCTAGLCVGIDKWSSPVYTKVFLSVCIGRMTANLMEAYNATPIRFSPEQEKILYRANRARAHGKLEDISSIVNAVNYTLKQDTINDGRDLRVVSEQELASLLFASNVLSIDSPVSDDSDEGISSYLANTASQDFLPDEILEKKELFSNLASAVDKLDLISIKVLKLKGLLG